MTMGSTPPRRRTYDQVHSDLAALASPLEDSSLVLGTAAYAAAWADYYERKAGLWREIVERAATDRSLPGWATLAAATVRDGLLREAEGLRVEQRKRARQEANPGG